MDCQLWQGRKVEWIVWTMMACLKIPKDKQKHEEIGSKEGTRRRKRMVYAGRMIGITQGTCTKKQQKKRLKTVHNKLTKLSQGSASCWQGVKAKMEGPRGVFEKK